MIGYALRADYAGDVELDGETVPRYRGGLLAIDGARDFDVRAELDRSVDGVIVVDEANAALVAALDDYPALKRVPAPAGGPYIGPFDLKDTDQLRDELRILGQPVSGNRDTLVARLEALRGGTSPAATDAASGDLGVAGEPGPPAPPPDTTGDNPPADTDTPPEA